MNIIETENLTRRFGKTEAVAGLDLQIPTGRVCALLGPNGAGKTTTIKLIMNLLTPTQGIARVMGVDSRNLGPHELAQIGYVSENQQLPLWMTIRQLLDYCRPFYPDWDPTLERTLLEQFDLPEKRKLKELSRGMLMKVALLSSLAYRPKLLVLDEPFSGLDPLVRSEFVRGVLEVSSLGDWTVFISSHDIDEVDRLCDHIILLDGGRLRLSESAETLYARFRRVEVTLQGGPALVGTLPPSWLELERAGELVRFVDSDFNSEATERRCREMFPTGAVTAHAMSLREIYLTLARTGRAEAKGAAA